MPTSFNIRSASVSDADSVFKLVEQLSDSYTVDEAAFGLAFAEAVSPSNANVLLVAEDADGAVLGYALMTVAHLMYTRDDVAQIQELIVDLGSRGHGVGSQLVYAVEDACRERGISQLTVASSKAPAFYDRLDYRSTADFLKKVFDSEL